LHGHIYLLNIDKQPSTPRGLSIEGKPNNHRERWTKNEINKLRSLANQVLSTIEISRQLRRTRNAIYSEASDENILLKPSP
jgi:hypothetical protein